MLTFGKILAFVCCCSVLHAHARAQAPLPKEAASPFQDGLQIVTVRPDFHVITGAGANIGVQIGPHGAIVVDTGTEEASEKTLAAIKGLTTGPIRYILNTGAGNDHLGGNTTLSKAGRSLLRGGQRHMAPADVLMPDAVMQHLLTNHPEAVDGDHIKAFSGDQYSMYLNGEGIQIIRQPAAHSDRDAIVFFRRSDVIMAGDVVDMDRFPVIDVANGGSIQGEIDALNRLVDMLIPPFPQNFQEERTILVPGHGRVADWTDLVQYRDMVTIIRDVVQDMINRGMTLQQVHDADPAAGYRTRYGADSGPWTTKMFVEAVYTGLKNGKTTP